MPNFEKVYPSTKMSVITGAWLSVAEQIPKTKHSKEHFFVTKAATHLDTGCSIFFYFPKRTPTPLVLRNLRMHDLR